MPIRATEILPGNAGIRQTVDRMIALMHSGHEWVKGQTVRILLDHLGPDWSNWSKALAIHDWVQRHLIYQRDGDAPDSLFRDLDVEELRSPEYLLRGIANAGVAHGDCDDYVILMGALLRSAGVPVTVVLTSARADGEYDHVFLMVQTEGGPIYSDAIHGSPFGWHLPFERVTSMEEIPVP